MRAALAEIEPADIPRRVAEIVGSWVTRVLGDHTEADRADGAVELTRQLLELLRAIAPQAIEDGDALAAAAATTDRH